MALGCFAGARNDGGGQSAGTLSSAKEKDIKQRDLVLILSELHDEVDRLTAESYGWPQNLLEDDVLAQLDAERAKVTLTDLSQCAGKDQGRRRHCERQRSNPGAARRAFGGSGRWPWVASLRSQ